MDDSALYYDSTTVQQSGSALTLLYCTRVVSSKVYQRIATLHSMRVCAEPRVVNSGRQTGHEWGFHISKEALRALRASDHSPNDRRHCHYCRMKWSNRVCLHSYSFYCELVLVLLNFYDCEFATQVNELRFNGSKAYYRFVSASNPIN